LDWNLNSNQLYKYKVNININENQILQITIHISIITTLIKILQVTKELGDYKEIKKIPKSNLDLLILHSLQKKQQRQKKWFVNVKMFASPLVRQC
jgi:hypothetical protein